MLYAVIDTGVCAARGLDPRETARACLRGGARLLQLRAKDLPDDTRLALAAALARDAADASALFIVNDRPDIAVLAGAPGVHVGQEDLPVDAARRTMGDAAVVGLSTHSPAQIDAAVRTTASYIAVGPVFETATKDTGYAARGLRLVSYAAATGRRVVAIGGITLERAPEVLQAGAWALAVITDLVAHGDVEARVRAWTTALAARPVKV